MPLIARRALGAIAIVVGLLLTVASPPALADTSSCSTPTFTQPFSKWGDYNWYTLVPGQTPGNFDGSGWILGPGASLVTTTTYGGGTATTLQLTSGAWAISPRTCVDSSDQAARMMIRATSGSPQVWAGAAYQDNSGSWQAQSMGQVGETSTWNPSSVLTMTPPSGDGWYMARFGFWAWGGGATQIYNFYVDPYSRG